MLLHAVALFCLVILAPAVVGAFAVHGGSTKLGFRQQSLAFQGLMANLTHNLHSCICNSMFKFSFQASRHFLYPDSQVFEQIYDAYSQYLSSSAVQVLQVILLGRLP